jgi:ATP-dependent DNA helicase RecG
LLKTPEGKTLEFKRDLSSPKPLLKTLIAFANTAGGIIIVGVDDNKELHGVTDPFAAEEKLCSLIFDSIEPKLLPNIEFFTTEDKCLLLVEVFPSGLLPHFLKAEGREQGTYVRLGSTNRQADRDLIAELERTGSSKSFDEIMQPQFFAEALDHNAIGKAFVNRRIVNTTTLINLKLLTPNQGKLSPTNGAILLFGQNRSELFPDAWVQCGRFAGADKSTIVDHTEIHLPLPFVADEVTAFLKKHANKGADFSEIRRKDVWNIPLVVLREAIVNALLHADYSQRGAPMRVSYFDDRIEIENAGILLPGLTIDDIIAGGVSKVRNPVIARVFKELGLIEQWGSGVQRMFKEAEKLNLPTPELVEICWVTPTQSCGSSIN